MEKKLLIGLVILLFTSSCSRDDGPAEEIILKDQTFVHLFFDSEEECKEAQPDPDFWINCHQELNFLEENKVVLMLTDILWNGTYIVKGDLVILKFEQSYEVPSGEMVFKILNPAELILIENNTHWKMVSGNSIWD